VYAPVSEQAGEGGLLVAPKRSREKGRKPGASCASARCNPANVPIAEASLRDMPEAARAIGLQIQVANASTIREIEAAFAALVRERPTPVRRRRNPISDPVRR
jgi:hypothetical protein